jgi:DNA-binding GntR family transcriptional regulator
MPPEPQVRKPRYLEMAEELRAQIARGDFPEADQFPTEAVLCQRYGVSRFTVREALRTLQTEGLIQRRRGSGTVIQPAAARGGALHQPLSNVAEILQYARDTHFVFARDGVANLPRKLAEEIGVPLASGPWPRFRGVRSSTIDERPIAVTDAYVHPDLGDVADQIDPAAQTIFRQIETIAKLKIARVTQDIQAVPASADVAAALGVKRRSACLRILRCYLDPSGRVIEISASHHPGDRFAYNMHIEVER